MRQARAHKPAAVALLQLGSEVHSALGSAARQSGHSKSEFVRLAVRGAIKAQDGYWERLLVNVFCAVPELVEAAADAGLLTKEEAQNICRPIDAVRQRLYGELDRIDGLPSIHWAPVEGEPVRSYKEVMRTRASRDELVRPEIEPLERLQNRFSELAAQRFEQGRKKSEASVQERKRAESRPSPEELERLSKPELDGRPLPPRIKKGRGGGKR